MDRDATIDRVAALTASAAREGAQLVVFPEVFVPGTPLWIDTQPIWGRGRGVVRPAGAERRGDRRPATDRLSAVDLDGAGELITYCTIGGRACTAWFVLTYLLGRESVRVYDGSWAVWPDGRCPGGAGLTV